MDVVQALSALSDFYVENTLSNRRRLRSELEKRAVTVNKHMVNAFADVKLVSQSRATLPLHAARCTDWTGHLCCSQELSGVEASVNALNESCAAIMARIHSARETTATLVQRTADLQNQM